MSQKSKILATFGALVVIGATLVGISVANDQAQHDTKPATQQKKEQPLQISYQGEDGKNALELLKKEYNVETKTYEGMGEMVTVINGVAPSSKQFWAFYINGKQSQVGADQYVTKAADTLTWKLEAIQ